MNTRVHIVADGSLGDVLPFITLCEWLQQAGHDAVLYSNAIHSAEIFARRLNFVPIGDPVLYRQALNQLDAPDGQTALHHAVKEYFAPQTETTATALQQHQLPHQKNILISSHLMFGAKFISELQGWPLLQLVQQPAVLAASGESLNSAMTAVARLRQVHGLAERPHLFAHWRWADSRWGLWPAELLADRVTSEPWPTLAPLPLAMKTPVPTDSQRRLYETCQVVFYFGSPYEVDAADLAEVEEFSRLANKKCLVIDPHHPAIAASCGLNLVLCPGVDFSSLTGIEFLFHHGGINTCWWALANRLRQAVLPRGFDQFFNAELLQKNHGIPQLPYRQISGEALFALYERAPRPTGALNYSTPADFLTRFRTWTGM